MPVNGSRRFITPSTESSIAQLSALTSKNKKTQSVHENVPDRLSGDQSEGGNLLPL